MSKPMFDPKTHAEMLPKWKEWAAASNLKVPPAVLYNYIPNTEGSRIADAIAEEREACAATIESIMAADDSPHCCRLADDGTVEEQRPCTCWRSKLPAAIRARGGE